MNVILSGDLDSHLAHLAARSEGNCSSQPILRCRRHDIVAFHIV